MKKNLKRTLAKVMAVALTVALAGTAAPDADAAKKIKLSSKSITVAKGKTKKVTIKNVKKNKVKKLTVKSSNKKVATVKKSGKTAFKVTGKKAGKSAKITASVTVKGKKKATKLTLKVKVQKATTPTPSVPTAAPTAAASATPAASAAAPGTSGNPAGPGTQTEAPAPGTSEEPTPGTSDNPATQAPVTQAPATQAPSYETTAIENIQLGGTDHEKTTYFKVEDGTAHLITNENAKYGNIFTYFDVVVPDGASVKDIKKISFDFEAIAGDIGYKQLFLIAGSTANVGEAIDAFPGEVQFEHSTKVFSNVTNVAVDEAYISFNGAGETEGEFEVDSALIEDMDLIDNTIRFSIYVNLDGVKDGVNTEYKLGNIQVYSTEGKAMTDGNDTPGATIDKTADVEPSASLTLGVGSIALTETTSAEVAVGNTNLVGEIASVEWTSSDDEIATVTAAKGDDTKAVISAVAAGKAEISAKITTAKGKVATVKKEVTVTEEALKDLSITMTAENTISASDNTNEFSVENGVASIAGQSAYDDCIGITVKLPDGVKLADYSGVQITVTNTGSGEVNKWAQAAVNKYDYSTWNGKGSGGALGWQNVIASNYAADNYTDKIAAGKSEDLVLSFANGKGVPDDVPGEFLLMIGVKGINSDTPYEISNVKLLAKLPAAE